MGSTTASQATHAPDRTQAIERTHAVERTQALERTHATEPERAPSTPAIGLHLSRRFDSAAAIRRLSEARGEDRLAMSPAGTARKGGLLSDRGLLAAACSVIVAIALAAFIALA